jgi:hypothetical protein
MSETKNFRVLQAVALVSFSVLVTRRKRLRNSRKTVIIFKGKILMVNEPKIIQG